MYESDERALGGTEGEKEAKGGRKERMPYLDAVLARSSNDLARVELQRSDGMVVLQRLKDAARAHVPNLCSQHRHPHQDQQLSLGTRRRKVWETYADRLVEAAGDDMQLIELKAGDRAGMAEKRAMWLASAH